MHTRIDILEKENEIRQWINEHQSKAFICRQLHCKPETLERYLKIMGISYSGNQSGKDIRKSNQYIDAISYSKGSCVKSHILKLKILRDGLRPHECEICHNTEWNGQPIPLELHHINGNHYDNSWDNLQLLCPNCHAQQENNSGAANKKEK